MKNVALITGASSGIGKALATVHAQRGGDLVLVARREKELNTIKQNLEKEHNINVVVYPADLSDRINVDALYEFLSAKNIEVELLINNAGFGGYGKFHERQWDQDETMMDLNMLALAMLTRYILPGMVARNSGKILNVASTAGFLPGPFQAVYYASKAFVRSFSLALSEELSDTAVTVTILSPGPVETEFEKTANLEGTELFNKNVKSAAYVAELGYEALMDGKKEVISDKFAGFALRRVLPIMPVNMVLKTVRRMQEKKAG